MIDWPNLEVLSSPKRKLCDPLSRERIARLRIRQHSKPKNHGTGKWKAHFRALKKARLAKTTATNKAWYSDRLQRVRAYWLGEADAHP